MYLLPTLCNFTEVVNTTKTIIVENIWDIPIFMSLYSCILNVPKGTYTLYI